MVVSWPSVIKQGRVSNALVSSVDFFPTLCEAAQVKDLHSVDGISILPHLLGKPATPRESIYVWYSPRQKLDLTVKEYAFNREFKLYRSGELFRVDKDPLEKNSVEQNSLNDNESADVKTLRKTLDQFTNARPKELDRQFSDAMKKKE
jgi:arylsulfatase A